MAGGHVPADRTTHIADPVPDVHRDPFFGDAVVVFICAVVKFSDRGDLVSVGGQAVPPAGSFVAHIGMGVVPVPCLMAIAPGEEVGARGHADREIAVGVVEAHPIGGQPVQIGGLDLWVPVAAGHAARVFVRHDDQQVHWLHGNAFRVRSSGDPRGRGNCPARGNNPANSLTSPQAAAGNRRPPRRPSAGSRPRRTRPG